MVVQIDTRTERTGTLGGQLKSGPRLVTEGLTTTLMPKEHVMADCNHTCRVCAALANPNLPARFWAKVEITEGCWEWTAARSDKGYGRFDIGGVPAYAHRVSFELVHGDIPDGLQIDHMCWNRGCVNPAHLRAVTPIVNYENRRLPGKRRGAAAGEPLGTVSWLKRRKKWQAAIQRNGKYYWGGYHQTEAAAEAALIALRKSVIEAELAGGESDEA